MYQNELTFRNHANGLKVAQMLLDEHYVVMLSYEEDLLVINYEWSHNSNRNDIVFMPRDEYEEDYDNFRNEIYDSVRDEVLKDLAFEGRLK